jgi:hypothetical protein
MEINVQILLLIVLGAITLLAYMIALNAQGPKRLAVSYLIATGLLVVCVWTTIQYVRSGDELKKKEELIRLENEKQKAEEQMHAQEAAMNAALTENKERLALAGRIGGIISRGSGLSSSIINTNLGDMNAELETLLSKANETKRKVDDLSAEFDKIVLSDTAFTQVFSIIKDAFKQMHEAVQYYVLYYHAEDSSQEELREKIMRQKATTSHDLLMKAQTLISSIGQQK